MLIMLIDLSDSSSTEHGEFTTSLALMAITLKVIC